MALHRVVRLGPVVVVAWSLLALPACDLPFGVGLPATRALESGAADVLDSAGSFEITGSYLEAGVRWSLDLQLARQSAAKHIVASTSDQKLEAIVLGKDAYFRGRRFLSQHLGSDPVSQGLLAAVGDAWWKGAAGDAPQLPNLTTGSGFRATLLGPALTGRTDHVSVDGVDAVDLAGSRADVYLEASPPYQPLRVQMRKGVSVDGLTEADLRYGNFDRDFGIKAPPASQVLDFSNLSSLPPLYTVVSVDTSRCVSGSACVVSALLKNLGATQPARGPSTVTFVMTDNASQRQLGSCRATVSPNVGYNATTTVGCTIDGVSTAGAGAATVTATPNNPGRA